MVGATGLIKALSYDYLTKLAHPRSISWVCNHSRNTQLALLHDYVDIAFTYERHQEAISTSEHWAENAGCVFHDHFILVGPASDPAGIRQEPTLLDSFHKIATTGSLFHSRNDGSATMWKERALWSSIGLQPWKDSKSSNWYKSLNGGPPEALIRADTKGAYLLTDRSTLLRQTVLRTIVSSRVFFEPVTSDDLLMNSCHALYSRSASPTKKMAVSDFLDYLLSSRGQAIIASFGSDEVGKPFFAPVQDGLATSHLVGGRPWKGRWVLDSEVQIPAKL